MNLVKDCEFVQLMKAGCPSTSLLIPVTVAQVVKLLFEKCWGWIEKILKVWLTLAFKFYIVTILIHFLGSSGMYSLCHWCLDFPEPSCVCGMDGSFAPWRKSVGLHFGYCWSSWGKFVGVHKYHDTNTLFIAGIQSHTGETLAKAFHDMLIEHKLSNKVSKFVLNLSILISDSLSVDSCFQWWQHFFQR